MVGTVAPPVEYGGTVLSMVETLPSSSPILA
jgi:hypothetical protein